MTTSTTAHGGFPPPPPAAGPTDPPRVLRRSRTDRVGAGVAGGLGAYFRVDPVLFRVLFATGAFFGGSGLLAYLLAWAAIPEEGTVRAPIDRFVGELRRRRVPLWLVAGVTALLLWAVAFSWWAPGRFLPAIIIVIVLVAIFGRRARAYPPGDEPGFLQTPAATPGVESPSPPRSAAGLGPVTAPAWRAEARQWVTEARHASRDRRRRAYPVRVAALGTLIVTLGVLAAVDAVSGIAIPVYFWVSLGIVAAALLVGAALRRTPWTLATLLVPAVLGLVAFGGTGARLHDGVGQRDVTPTSGAELAGAYRLALGEQVLDLRHLAALGSARRVTVTLGAGQVRILAPATMNLTVRAEVHLGQITVDPGDQVTDGPRGGVNVSRTILPPPGARGPAVTIDVHVADGTIAVEHR